MRRVPAPHWYTPKRPDHEPFCKVAADAQEARHALYLITDPKAAFDYWNEYGFREMAKWAAAGFPEAIRCGSGDIWILSPDPGKEIHGDS